jgi:hypothetical protein
MLVEYYDDPKVELYDLGADIREQHDLAARQPERVAQLRAALDRWRKEVGAQSNRPNPQYSLARFRELYVDVDASRFEPAVADLARWEQMWSWRQGMNAAVPRAAKKGKGR